MGCVRTFKMITMVCLAAIVLFTCAGIASAQTFRGTILGTVTDSSGSSIAGAAVVVKNTNTGLSRTVTTSEDGTYSVPELPIGTYSVTVEKAGFKQGVVTGLQVEVSTERRADVTLQTGEVSQKIEVIGDEMPQVESTSNVLGGIVESKVVTNLPVNGRDYQKLIFLVPGVSGSPDQITDSPGSYGVFSVNGARGRSNNFLLDGTDMNDGYRNDPAINEAGVFGTPATIRTQRRRRHKRSHQERLQPVAWLSVRILPQYRSQCAELLQSGSRTAAAISQQPVRRFAGWSDHPRQDFLFSRL